MAEDTSISYSFTVPPATAASDLYAFADCDLIGIDGAMSLVINRQNGRQQMIAPQVLEALKTCTTFRTLEQHADQLAATRPELQGNRAMALQVLQQLRDSGMLLAASTICERLSQKDEAPLAPTRAFIITCDRPAAVERLLESLLRVGSLTRHQALYLVDDSRDTANREANRELVSRFNLTSARDMHYFGAEEQSSLLASLVEALPEHESGIRFLIDPTRWTGKATYGRARTLCLMLSVGARAIVMDDDILCQAVLPPMSETGLSLSGERKAAFYENRDSLMARARPASFDPLSGHAELLGRSVGASFSQVNEGPLRPEQLSDSNAAMLNVLGSDSRILVTQCGAWGDPGTGNAHWALHLGEDSIERLVNAPHGMGAALENRCNWLGCDRPTLHKMAFMSQMTGIDNSVLIPPYFPAFRGEDLLFGAMIEAMHHNCSAFEYPWSVPHLPLEDRSDRGLREPIAGEGGTVLFARYLTENIDYGDATDPLRRLQSIAEDARRLAMRSEADLLLDYRKEQAKYEASRLFLLRRQRVRAEELPSLNWQGYLDRSIEEVQSSLAAVHSPTAIKNATQSDNDSAVVELFRELALGWADALAAWPAMRAVAAERG